MAAVRSVLYLIGFGGFGYALMKVVSRNDESIYLKKYPGTSKEHDDDTLHKRQAIVDHLRLAAELKEPIYRQTKDRIDAIKDELLTKKKQ